MNCRLFPLLFLLVSFTPVFGFSAVSSTVTLASDYLFNGVSQTDEKPALQASFDWAGESGVYSGVWASNVDFGEGTEVELDGYLGYSSAVTESVNIDVGVAQYTYHGESFSSDYNYPEVWIKFNRGNANLNYWYSWDYFGTGAGHSIIMLSHHFPVNDKWFVEVGVDRSFSHDKEKWRWEEGDSHYTHAKVSGTYSLKHWLITLGYEWTDLERYGDSTLVFSVQRTFNF